MSYTPPPPPPDESGEGAPSYGGPGSSQPAYGQPGYGPPAYGPPRNNTKAVVSLIIGIASLPFGLCCAFFGLIGIAAIVVGNNAKSEIAASGGMQTGLGMAKAGVILGIVGVVLGVLTTIVNITLMATGNGNFEFNTVTG